MKRHELFFRLLTKAAWVHKGRALTALLSIGVMSAMTTVVLTVHYGVEAKLNREFRSFGGNAIATEFLQKKISCWHTGPQATRQLCL